MRARIPGALLALFIVASSQPAFASQACGLINGLSGEVAPGQTIVLNPSQNAKFVILDDIELHAESVDGGAHADFIMLNGTPINFLLGVVEGHPASKRGVFSKGDEFIAPAGSIQVSASAQNAGKISYSVACESPPVTLNSISPSVGAAGTDVVIQGQGSLQDTTAVHFGDQLAAFTINSDRQLTVRVPAGKGTVPVVVTTSGGGDSRPLQFTYGNVPTGQPFPVSTTVDSPVTIQPPTDAQGTWDSILVGSSPSHGQVRVDGRSLIYTPAPGFVGVDTFTYQLSNAFGMSPASAVNVTVTRAGGAAGNSRTVTVAPGVPVNVDLSTMSPGGSTAASLVGMSPANAGQVSLSAQGLLRFTSTADFRGLVQFSALLSGSGGASTPVNVLVLVSSEPDPSKNASVLGLVNAQAEQARRFAQGQIDTIGGRLETLHDRSEVPTFSNNVSLTVNGRPFSMQRAGSAGEQGLERTGKGAASSVAGSGERSGDPVDVASEHGLRAWIGGQASFGSFQSYRRAAGFDSDTISLTAGMDTRIGDHALAGVAFGYSHDNADVGNDGTRSVAKGYSAALYASVQPAEHSYVDLVLGGGGLSFDSRRKDADSEQRLTGRRTGHQWFGSLTAGLQYKTGHWLWSPYGRASWSMSSLNGFAEEGTVTGALAYGNQTVRSTVAAIGVRASGDFATSWGSVAPRARLEAGHDFQGTSRTTVGYAFIPSAGEWSVLGNQYSSSGTRVQMGLGLDLRWTNGWLLGTEYSYLTMPRAHDQMLRFSLNKSF
ncbi:hypothetical protein GCM10009552_07330 [Rothia nasimurium]